MNKVAKFKPFRKDGKFELDPLFFDRIIELFHLKYAALKREVHYSAEELVGFHSWSELMPHEKDMAVIVFKQSTLTNDFPMEEVDVTDGAAFKLL